MEVLSQSQDGSCTFHQSQGAMTCIKAFYSIFLGSENYIQWLHSTRPRGLPFSRSQWLANTIPSRSTAIGNVIQCSPASKQGKKEGPVLKFCD